MKTIECDLLKVSISVFKSLKSYKKACKRLGFKSEIEDLENQSNGYGGVEWFDGIPYFFLIIKDVTDLGLIVHETSHLVDYLLEYKGISDGETRAYFHEWLFRAIIK